MNSADSTVRPAAPPRHLPALLGALAMFGAFSIDTIFPAFAHIAAQFGASKLAMQQTISVYLAAYALMSLVHGPLSDALGRRRVIMVGLGGFAAASVGCALATSLSWLLTFRALQGLCAGVGLIVGRAVIRDVYAGAAAQKVMSQVSMVFSIAPAVAPIVGGVLIARWPWPAIFVFLAALGASVLLATSRWLPETLPPAAQTAITPAAVGRGYLQIAGNARFMRLSVVAALNFGALFLYIAAAPEFVMRHLHRGENDFWMFFVPVIASMSAGAFVSGRVAGFWSQSRQLRVGFACCAVAALANIALNAMLAPQLPWVVLPVMLQAFGIALVSPIITLQNLDMYPERRGAASSVQAFVGLVSNALVAGVVSPWVSATTLGLSVASAVFAVLAFVVWQWGGRAGPGA